MHLNELNRKIERKIEDANHEHSRLYENADRVLKKIARGALKHGNSSDEARVKNRDMSDLAEYYLSKRPEEVFSKDRITQLQELSKVFTKEAALSRLPSNKEYLFLSKIHDKDFSDKDIRKIQAGLGLSERDVEKIKENHIADWLSDKEKTKLISGKLSSTDKREYQRRGFYYEASKAEQEFLREINGKNMNIYSEQFNAAAKNNNINEQNIRKLLSFGYIKGVDQRVVNYFNSNGRFENLKDHGISYADLKKSYGDSWGKRTGREVKSIKQSDLNDLERKYLEKYIHYKQLGKKINKEELSPFYKVNNGRTTPLIHFKKVEDCVVFYKKNEPFLYSAKIKTIPGLICKDVRAKSLYGNDGIETIRYRACQPTSVLLERTDKDVAFDNKVIMKASAGEKLTKREVNRWLELSLAKVEVNQKILPTVRESSFLQVVQKRGLTNPDLLSRIGKRDFGLSDEQISRLVRYGFTDGWTDPKCLIDARIAYQAKLLVETIQPAKQQGFDRQEKQIKNLLSRYDASRGQIDAVGFAEKCDFVKRSSGDYLISLKHLNSLPLTKFEQDRIRYLASCGIFAEFDKKFLLEKPESWKMVGARKRALAKVFIEKFNPNVEALKFVNSFKQVTRQHLYAMGLSDADILRYTNKSPLLGIRCDGGGLLQKHVVKTREHQACAIEYFSIQHKGLISGRTLLEQYIPKDKIAPSPQLRTDLLPHDLKVVSCVLDVIDSIKEKGGKIVSVKNEATCFSEGKMGKLNHERSDGVTYMDAVLEVEWFQEVHNEHGVSVSSGKSTVAVEYGNYKTAIMAHKINNSEFDIAHVYASEKYIKRYQKIQTHKQVVFHKI